MRYLSGLIAGLFLATGAVHGQEVWLTGRVVDENNAGVSAARISVRPAAGGRASDEILAGPTGLFRISLPAPGHYLLSVRQTGYFPLADKPVEAGPGAPEVHLALNHLREVFSSVQVTADPARLDLDRTDSQQTLTGLNIIDVPYPSTHSLRNAMRLIPGVVQDAGGSVHFNGGTENQVLYTLDGFNISDPLTGTFQSHLSVDSVRSMDYSSGRFSPEYGKGSSGTLAIQTDLGSDQFHTSSTNFIPGVDTKNGLHMGSWTPRFGFSGPIVRGRAWFADNIEGQYDVNVIDGLPKGADRTRSFRGSNLLHAQVNLTPRQILFTDFLVNYFNAPGSGLSVLDPPSTTIDQRSREWFYSAKDQLYFARGILLEFGFAQNRTYGRLIPQGGQLYQITPNGHAGNYFVNSTQASRRDQFLSNLFLPSFKFYGRHQFKFGTDLNRLEYRADMARSGYELFGLNGALLQRTTYAGSGVFGRPNTEVASYVLDSWRPSQNVSVDLGLRQDWDELVSRIQLSPRFAVAWAPFGARNTKVTAGYATIYDASNLALFARPMDQYAVTSLYAPNGALLQPPSLTVFTIRNQHLNSARFSNWTAGLEQRLPRRLDVEFNLLRKRGGGGFAYTNLLDNGGVPPDIAAQYPGQPFAGVYALENIKNMEYDSAQVTVRQSIGDNYQWMASYTRSRAYSNQVVDFSVDQPLYVAQNAGPLPWDAPNRLLSWGYLPTPWKKWAISYLLDVRNGFPFSIQRDTGQVIGGVDSFRLPAWFELDLHVERRITLRGYRLALRGGFNNITNHQNYTLANTMYGAPGFLQYYGTDGRHFVLRIRWLGKE